MPDSIILRFRDVTGDDPIGKHRQIITVAGYVWWGWWKKDSEPHRLNELGELRERATKSGISVGLFDRSSRTFYAAQVIDCVFSEGPISSPEPQKTPNYYASGKVPCWFKFTNIEGLDEKRFIERFAVPPTGDGTLFPLWYGRPFPTSSTSSGPRLSSSMILHLSDVHLGVDYAFPAAKGPGATPLVDVIERDFRDEKPGLIVMSGDLTTRADANVLQDEGVRFLSTITDKLGLSRECVIVVPGNHDIALKKFRSLDYSHETSFHLFLQAFYGEPMDFPGVRVFELPNGRLLEILTINSVRLRHESEKQFGYVQWPLYEDVLSRIPRKPNSIRIAILHHHLVAAPREELFDTEYPEAGVSATLDAGAVIEGLQAHGFDLVLHGHQHVPAITRVSRGRDSGGPNVAKLEAGLIVLAAGSAGASRLADEMRDNSYNVLRLDEKGFQVEARRYNPGMKPQRYFCYRSEWNSSSKRKGKPG